MEKYFILYKTEFGDFYYTYHGDITSNCYAGSYKKEKGMKEWLKSMGYKYVEVN